MLRFCWNFHHWPLPVMKISSKWKHFQFWQPLVTKIIIMPLFLFHRWCGHATLGVGHYLLHIRWLMPFHIWERLAQLISTKCSCIQTNNAWGGVNCLQTASDGGITHTRWGRDGHGQGKIMMKSWHGNAQITGPLWGESTAPFTKSLINRRPIKWSFGVSFVVSLMNGLTHRGWVMHKCVSELDHRWFT